MTEGSARATPPEPAQEPPQQDEEGVARVRDIIEDMKICMLTLGGAGGTLVSRPMAVQEVEFDGDLWFFSQADAHKAEAVAAQPPANVAFSDTSQWLSVSSLAEVVDDPARKEELWEGPGRVATAIALVKSRVRSDDQPGVGNHETVRMP